MYRLQKKTNASCNVSRTNASHSHHSLRKQAIVVHGSVTGRHHRSATKSYHVKRLRCKSFFAAAAYRGGGPVACESSDAVRGLAGDDLLARGGDGGGRARSTERRMVSALYYDSLCNSRIVFNGTFPIDRPFGVRQSLCNARPQVFFVGFCT